MSIDCREFQTEIDIKYMIEKKFYLSTINFNFNFCNCLKRISFLENNIM